MLILIKMEYINKIKNLNIPGDIESSLNIALIFTSLPAITGLVVALQVNVYLKQIV